MNLVIKNAVDQSGRTLNLAVKDGRFVKESAPDPQSIDGEGCTVLPGFVDAHCHIIPMGLDMQKLHLGACATKSDVLDALREWAPECGSEWIHAVHYDQTKFSDASHLTRWDIDAVVSDRPVLLRHSNGHASVANTAALKAARIDESVKDPAGGTYVRDSAGRLSGVLLERAHEAVTSASPTPTLEEMTYAVVRAGKKMATLGITCATDMMTGRWNLAQELRAYSSAADAGCPIRLRLYAQWGTVLGPRGIDIEELRELTSAMDHDFCRLNGLKIFADGAIGSATAAIYGSYLTTGGDGQLIYDSDRLNSMVQLAHHQAWQVAIHTIGDRSTDVVMDALQATDDPTRHRVEHAMLLSDQQIDRLATLGCEVTMQPEFLLRFGHSYRKQLGSERAATIKRVASVLKAGVPLSFSSDRPIVPGDPWDAIQCAVQRPEGFDQSQNIPLGKAIELQTSASARANGDVGLMGSLEPGALADFQIFRGEPSRNTLVAVYRGGTKISP